MPYYVGHTVAAEGGWRNVTYDMDNGRADSPKFKIYEAHRQFFWGGEHCEGDHHPPVAQAELLPAYTFKMRRRRSTLPDFITGSGGSFLHWLISQRVRDEFDRFESGLHYYAPVEITRTDGTPWPESYWQFRSGPTSVVQAMIVEQSPNLVWKNRNSQGEPWPPHLYAIDKYATITPFSYYSVPIASGITLDEKAFVGRHIVLEEIFSYKPEGYFFSDELVAALKAARVKGFKYGKVRLETRRVPAYGPSSGTGNLLWR